MLYHLPVRTIGFICLILAILIAIIAFVMPEIYTSILDGIRFVEIFFATFFFLFLLALPPVLRESYNWLTETGNRFERVHLDFDTPIPDQMLGMAQDIENLGFTKLGVKALMLDENTPHRHWLWLDTSGTVVASLVEYMPDKSFAYFYTGYNDGFSFETAYNYQMEVNEANIMTHSLMSSISETYNFHLHLYDEQNVIHGQPRVHDTLASTDPTVEEYKQSMRGVYVGQIRNYGAFALFLGTLALATNLRYLLPDIYSGWQPIAGLIITGLSFTIIDYQSAFARLQPIDERKSRKAVEA